MQSLWMLVAGLAFALMGVVVKLASAHFATAELVFWRALVQALVAWALLSHAGLRIRTPKLGMHVHRGVAGFASLFMFFYALTALPVATAMTLNYSSPLFLAILLAVLARERPDAKLVGTVLIELVRLDEPEARVVFYFGLFALAGALVWMAPQRWHVPTAQTWWMILGVGGLGALGQVAMTRAYGQGSTLVTAALSYSGIVFSSVIGVAWLGDRPSWAAWLGILLIVAAGILAVQLGPDRRREDAAAQVAND